MPRILKQQQDLEGSRLEWNEQAIRIKAHIPQVCADFLEISSIAPQLPLLIPIFLGNRCILSIKKHSFFFPRSSFYTH